jgi:hypothetical protein
MAGSDPAEASRQSAVKHRTAQDEIFPAVIFSGIASVKFSARDLSHILPVIEEFLGYVTS